MKRKYFLNKKKMRRNIIYFICCVGEIIKQRNEQREIYKLIIILFNFFIFFFQNKDKSRNYLFLWEESSSHREWETQCGTYDRAQPVRGRMTLLIRVNNLCGKWIPCFFIKLTNKVINKLLLKSICFLKKEFWKKIYIKIKKKCCF